MKRKTLIDCHTPDDFIVFCRYTDCSWNRNNTWYSHRNDFPLLITHMSKKVGI